MLMMFKASAAWALHWRKAIGFYFIMTSLIGDYIHTWQGLYNTATNSWNGTPNIDQSWNIMRWDWRFPQFMATNRQLNVHTHEQELSGLVLEHMAGIPRDELPRVGERFFRASNATQPGTGLGLAIVRSIAERHGGRLEAANAQAGGALFTLSLPLAPA